MSALVELYCVEPARVAIIWPRVGQWINHAMERGGMGRFADVEADVLGANANLWLATENGAVLAAAVTKVTAEDGKRVCTIVACAGHGWARFGALLTKLETHAWAKGCSEMEICGRPGWLRRLKDYRLVKAVIRKSL